MTTKIYFNVTWIFKDDRNIVSSSFCVEMHQDVFESIPNTDSQEQQHIYTQFRSAFFKAFPKFNNTEYKIIAIGSYDRVLMIDLTSHFYCYQLVELIEKNKGTCNKAAKAIPLTIVQRRRTQAPSERALAATNIVCRECHGSIMGISFRCSECEDYSMCSLCVTSGKHPQHLVNRATDSKKDRDTVAKPKSTSVKIEKEDSTSKTLVKKLEVENKKQGATIKEQAAKNKEQDAKIKELNAENKRLVAAHSEAMKCLGRESGQRDRSPSPEDNKRKLRSSKGSQNKNIKLEVIDVE